MKNPPRNTVLGPMYRSDVLFQVTQAKSVATVSKLREEKRRRMGHIWAALNTVENFFILPEFSIS